MLDEFDDEEPAIQMSEVLDEFDDEEPVRQETDNGDGTITNAGSVSLPVYTNADVTQQSGLY